MKRSFVNRFVLSVVAGAAIVLAAACGRSPSAPTAQTAQGAIPTSEAVGTGTVFSHAAGATPTVSITSPTDGTVLEFTSFPQVVDVLGTVARTFDGTGNGNWHLCGVELTVKVDDGIAETQLGFTDKVSAGTGATCATSSNWSYPWTITDPGIFTITAIAKGRPNEDTHEATDEAEVTVLQQTVIASYPAAPSVAARLLHDADAPARYGSGKTGGNHIADVAREMGPGTDFEGVPKSQVAAYRCKVAQFLNNKTNPANPAVSESSCP